MSLIPSSPRDSVEEMESLIALVPFARPIYEEHISENDEILPHVLMADLRRLFVELVNQGDQEKVRDLLGAIETMAACRARASRTSSTSPSSRTSTWIARSAVP
jgi:hypothetical protein